MIKKVREEEGRFLIIYKSPKRLLNIFFFVRFLLNFGQIVRHDRLEIKML